MDTTIPVPIAVAVALAVARSVDRLGEIRGRIADLQAERAALEALILDTGEKVIEGHYYRAAVAHCEGRETVDWQTIAKRFEPSRQLIVANTKIGAPYDMVRVSARKSS